MKKILIRAGLLVAALVLTGCATPPAVQDYTAFRESKPRSILVLPPLNNSPEVNATSSILSLATYPLAESGYYVIPVSLMDETFKQNGMTTANDIHTVPQPKLREIFGADTALYVTVSKYGSTYTVIKSVVEVAVDAELVDLRSGRSLYKGTAFASSAENNNNNSGGLIGMLITAAIQQIANNVTDAGHGMANTATQRLLAAGRPNGMLYGPYSPKFGTD